MRAQQYFTLGAVLPFSRNQEGVDRSQAEDTGDWVAPSKRPVPRHLRSHAMRLCPSLDELTSGRRRRPQHDVPVAAQEHSGARGPERLHLFEEEIQLPQGGLETRVVVPRARHVARSGDSARAWHKALLGPPPTMFDTQQVQLPNERAKTVWPRTEEDATPLSPKSNCCNSSHPGAKDSCHKTMHVPRLLELQLRQEGAPLTSPRFLKIP